MNRVVIDKELLIEVKGGVIVSDGIKIPLQAIDMLILGSRVDIALKDLAKIAKKDVAILIVTSKPKEFLLLQKRYQKGGDLKAMQYHALDRRVEIAKEILAKKIERSYLALRRLGLDFEMRIFQKELERVEDIKSLLGIEGNVAKRYFELYFSLFPKVWAKGARSKNPPKDPINALLSYCHTIYYYEIAAWIGYYGFEPMIGYLHTPFRSHMALASDILELFRSDIDTLVARLVLDKEIVLRDFTNKGGIYLTQKGRKKLWAHLKNFMEEKEGRLKRSIAALRATLAKKSSYDPKRK